MITTVLRGDQVEMLAKTQAALARAVARLAESVDLGAKTGALITGSIVVEMAFVRELSDKLGLQVASMGFCPPPGRERPDSAQRRDTLFVGANERTGTSGCDAVGTPVAQEPSEGSAT